MSLARNLLLKASDSAWLREHGTKAPFVRRAVSRFMPGEAFDDMLGAARVMTGQGVPSVFTRLGENVKDLGEADYVCRHYLEVLDRIAELRPRLRAVDQADAARPRHRSRAGLRPPAGAGGARPATAAPISGSTWSSRPTSTSRWTSRAG